MSFDEFVKQRRKSYFDEQVFGMFEEVQHQCTQPQCHTHGHIDQAVNQAVGHSGGHLQQQMSSFEVLADNGIVLPPPDLLTDEQLSVLVLEIMQTLVAHAIIICHTDHLDARELYQFMLDELLHDLIIMPPAAVPQMSFVSLLARGSDEDVYLYLTYYASHEERLAFADEHPDQPMPEKQHPPRRRDHFFPHPNEFSAGVPILH